jgi:hypothetical protein
MSDHEQLLLVIVVIYLTDCVFWASRCAVVFRDSFLAGAFAVLHPSTYVGHDRGGIVWRNPLPPFGTTMICPARPVSVTPEHAFAYTAASALFGGRPEHPERIVALDEVKSVTVDAKDVLVNGKLFARTDSGVFARHLAESLDRLARLPMAERAGAIEAEIEASLDTTQIEARLVEFDRATSTLRLVCTCVFFLLFLLLPWVVFRDQFSVYWKHLLIGLVLGMVVIGVLYLRIHRALYPDDRAGRRGGLAMMLLVPPAAIRACDELSRNLVAGFDALAVARVACNKETFSRMAGRLLRDLTHPALPVCSADDPEKLATEARHRAGLLRHYVRFLEREGERVDELMGPPDPDDGAVSYCPRCHEQFTIPGGECRNCGGIPLVAFPGASSRDAEDSVPSTIEDG